MEVKIEIRETRESRELREVMERHCGGCRYERD